MRAASNRSFGNAREEALQDVDRQRQLDRHIDQREADPRIVEPVLDENLEQRDDRDLRRENDGREQDEIDHAVEPKAIAREAVRRHRADDRQDGDGGQHDHRGILEIDVVVRIEPGDRKLLPMQNRRQREVIRHDLAGRAQRHDRDPHERSGRERRVSGQQDDEQRMLERLCHDGQYSSLLRWRSASVSVRTMASTMTNQIAAMVDG